MNGRLNIEKDLNSLFEQEFGKNWLMTEDKVKSNLLGYIKDLFYRNQLKIADYKITPAVEKIIGTLHLDQDYKEIRDKIIEDRIKDYEHLS